MSRRHRPRPRARRTTGTPAWRRAWSVDDALRIHARYVRWRATEAGAREMEVAMDKAPLLAARHAAAIDSHASTGEVAAAISSSEAEALGERDPIWCDPALGDLLAASTAGYPAEPLRRDHLVDPTVGMVVFARAADGLATTRRSRRRRARGRHHLEHPVAGHRVSAHLASRHPLHPIRNPRPLPRPDARRRHRRSLRLHPTGRLTTAATASAHRAATHQHDHVQPRTRPHTRATSRRSPPPANSRASTGSTCDTPNTAPPSYTRCAPNAPAPLTHSRCVATGYAGTGATNGSPASKNTATSGWSASPAATSPNPTRPATAS